MPQTLNFPEIVLYRYMQNSIFYQNRSGSNEEEASQDKTWKARCLNVRYISSEISCIFYCKRSNNTRANE